MMIDRMDSLEKSVHDVAQFIGTTRQNARKIIEQLENKGYVETSVSRFDARALSVKITRKGKNCLTKNAPLVSDATGELFAEVSDKELTAFAQTLGKLVATLTSEDDES
jgi:DNA-binding MarR family transcriptional regulator